MRLGVLDPCPVPAGDSASKSVRGAIEFAKDIESLGFERIWYAEHHSGHNFGSASPEVIIAAVAQCTSYLRVGAGGVILNNHPPLRIAEAFRTLSAIAPGRIDLGIARAPGGSPQAAQLLGNVKPESDTIAEYGARLQELLEFFSPFPFDPTVFAVPEDSPTPSVLILGSGLFSAAIASAFGLPLVFAHFVSPRRAEKVIATYRRDFRPSVLATRPEVHLAIQVLCLDTAQQAGHLAMDPRYLLGGKLEGILAGTPTAVDDALRSLNELHNPDSMIVVTLCENPQLRMRSYELLGDLFLSSRERITADTR